MILPILYVLAFMFIIAISFNMLNIHRNNSSLKNIKKKFKNINKNYLLEFQMDVPL